MWMIWNNLPIAISAPVCRGQRGQCGVLAEDQGFQFIKLLL
jgi:hypothetical protein